MQKYTSKNSEYIRDWEHYWEVLFSFNSICFIFFTLILDWRVSADPIWFGRGETKSVLGIQVYIEGRWLKLFLEWFMSSQTLRGQSKHKATLSNLLHPMLWHSCSNGSGLRRMTMNQAFTELFSHPYIDVEHVAGLSQSPHCISLKHLWERSSTFHLHHQNTRKDGISHRAVLRPSNKNHRKLTRVCKKREMNLFWQLVVIQHPTRSYCFCFLPQRVDWLSLKRLPTGHGFIQALQIVP